MAGVEEVEQGSGADLVAYLDAKQQTGEGEQNPLAGQVLVLGEHFGHGEGLPAQNAHHYHHDCGDQRLPHKLTGSEVPGAHLATMARYFRTYPAVQDTANLLQSALHPTPLPAT